MAIILVINIWKKEEEETLNHPGYLLVSTWH
jgi:hypothetical protein